MALGEHVSGLLNMSVFATALGLGYLGLDRFDPNAALLHGKQAADEGRLELEKEINETRTQFDLGGKGRYILGKIPVMVLEACLEEQPHLDKALDRMLFHFIKFYFVPPIALFKNERDLYPAIFLSFVCLFIFFLMTAATIWEIPAIDNSSFAHSSFYFYTFSIAWFIMFVFFKYRLLLLPLMVSRMIKRLQKRVDELVRGIATEVFFADEPQSHPK